MSVGTAVVTGGAGGLGAAIVTRLVRDGYTVAALDTAFADSEPKGTEPRSAEPRSVEPRSTEPGSTSIRNWHCDVADADNVQRVVQQVGEFYGGIDVLVNNAGLLTGRSSFLDATPAELHRVFGVNAVGAVIMTQACYPWLRSSGCRGRVINVASRTFFTGGPGQLAYVASKGALIGMTRVMARELGPDGITVNAVMPAQVATPGTRAHSGPDMFSTTMSQQSIQRFVTPDDFAALVAFVASPDASMITGQTMVCDGGALMH